MPSFKLDGVEIPFTPGETIITAAYRMGIEVPHYCWHPGLSVAANCRMCLVEIEPAANQRPMLLDVLVWDEEKKDYVPSKKPKLQPSCQMAASDGMVVKSNSSPHVAEARAHVQEYLLLNHPVDCPICDQAGECKLQDYYMSEQRTAKRMRDEPVHKPKAVPFGDTIVYDAERCIACTRCIRFCEEVTGDPVLDLRERGNKFEVIVSPGRKLDGHYTMMTELVCPVGALTTKYWRHKGRVWLLKSTQTVCPGCATGCNMWLDSDPREQSAFRNRPRDNEAVNKYWACDDGMITYQRIHQNRVLTARAGRGRDRKELSVSEAITRAATEIARAQGQSLAVVLSAQYSSEDNMVLADLAKAAGAAVYLTARPPWDGDKILRNPDQNPNRAGVSQVAGVEALKSMSDLVGDVQSGAITAIVALGPDVDVPVESLAALSGAKAFVLITTHEGALSQYASVTLPAATWGETEGTFVNAKGMAQEFKKALAHKGDSVPAWEAVSRLGRAMKLDIAYKRFAEVRAALVARTGTQPSPGHVDTSVDPMTRTPRAGV